MKNIVVTMLCIAVSLVAGCVIQPTVGSKPSDVPPKLITDPDNAKNQLWDNPGAFGPVPAELTRKGQQICGSIDTADVKFKAIGYHPKAQDINGKAFPEGGFYCVRR